ncbi:MAG: family 78 glycoside hydrolase catalytic domain [Bacillota bacterium]
MNKTAKYIWYDQNGLGRNLYGMFRKTLELRGKVDSAVISIFADTSYQLFINGEFVEYGPVRFDPRFPLYDTHDIARFLRPGKNVIAVLVNYIGHHTFKTIPARAGMIAWGAVETAGGKIVLDTGAGLWKGISSRVYGRYTPKLSFALNAQEHYDQNYEETGWNEADFDDSGWPGTVEIEGQNSWGPLKPRSIPFMSGQPVCIDKIVHALPLEKKDDLYSFYMPLPFFNNLVNGKSNPIKIVFTSWVYSPCDQIATIGTHYGENWINGEKTARGREVPGKSLRFDAQWKLKSGWNHLFGMVDAYQDILDLYFAFPLGKDLRLSADKNPDSPYLFKHSPALNGVDYQNKLGHKTLPFSPEDPLNEIGGWIYTTSADAAQSPCRETDWDGYAEPCEVLTPQTFQGHIFKGADYPHGFSVLIDFGFNHLLFPRIRLEGVKGAVIDLVYSDRVLEDGKHVRQLSWVPLGDRIICTGDSIDWMPAHPRGMRYLVITVRNIKGDVTFRSIALRSAAYPVVERGSFRCSDPCLNAVWEMGKRTQATNMEDAYVDCVDRERGMYVLDTVIQYHVNLAVFGDQALMRRCMELYSQSNHENGMFRGVYPVTGDYLLPDFALHAVEGYHAYYKNTGDGDLILQAWDAIQINLQRFHRLADERDDLLLCGDKPAEQDPGSNLTGFHGSVGVDNTGINCMYSCLYLLALKKSLELACAIGKQEDSRRLKQRIETLERTIPDTFWDPVKGCFSDNLSFKSHSIHTNLYAVRAGVICAERMGSVKKYLAEKLKSVFINGRDPSGGMLISTSDGFNLFEGLYRAGLYETAESVIRQAWGWFLTRGLKTCPEHFNLNASLCHAWTASPTYFLSRHILGVHFPEAPDLDKVEIRVQTHGVTEAEGAYPHPKGRIEVKWHLEDGIRVFDYIKAPAGVCVKVPDETFTLAG